MASDMGVQFYKNIKVVPGKHPHDAVGASSYFPATTAIDLLGYEYVDILVHAGDLNTKLTFTVFKNTASKYTSTAGLAAVSTTLAKNTIATSDDGKCLLFHINTANLGNYRYLGILGKGGSGSDDYADVLFFLHGAREKPVTQATAYVPSAHAKTYAG